MSTSASTCSGFWIRCTHPLDKPLGLSALLVQYPSLQVQDFLWVSGPVLTESDTAKLAQALRGVVVADPAADLPLEQGHCSWIAPRLGTVSPWSSKVQDWLAELGWPGLRVVPLTRCQWAMRPDAADTWFAVCDRLCDPLTQSLCTDYRDAIRSDHAVPGPLRHVRSAELEQVATEENWGLSSADIQRIAAYSSQTATVLTDAACMMYAQVNSEHCRHLIFRARWCIDGEWQTSSLMDGIRATHSARSVANWVAYDDNAAVVSGLGLREYWAPDSQNVYRSQKEPHGFLIKAETHNHPTGIAPDPGAATGVGGELRDEAATGVGARSRAGISGYTVNHFATGDYQVPVQATVWSAEHRLQPDYFARPETIMREAPLGAARYGNEFGRPQLAGFFRTYTHATTDPHWHWGYTKPVMLAGGIGSIRPSQLFKKDLPVGACIVVLGGPSYRIGLGGGAASSQQGAEHGKEGAWASVQRADPEMQRRVQQVIDSCVARGEANPILSLHDVGAGGLSNAVPELVHQAGLGALIHLHDAPCNDTSLSPMERWCNESQERFVLALTAEQLPILQAYCEREKCPFAVIGHTTHDGRLRVQYQRGGDAHQIETVVDWPLDWLLDNPEKREMRVHGLRSSRLRDQASLEPAHASATTAEMCTAILRYPAVSSKAFLIHIADRTVGGLTVQDQCVGPYQCPVADCAIVADDFTGKTGQAIAMGERPPIAVTDPAASVRMAIGEMVCNILASPVEQLSDIALSGNWMGAPDVSGEAQALWSGVQAARELCTVLGLTIPVGKDSLSMRTTCQPTAGVEPLTVCSPLSFVATGVARLHNLRDYLTPYWGHRAAGVQPLLLWIDLSGGRLRLGGSVYAQCLGMASDTPVPDLDNPLQLVQYHRALSAIRQTGALWAYHDISDGGLWACCAEYAFANRSGLELHIPAALSLWSALYAEELGAVWAVDPTQLQQIETCLRQYGLECGVHFHVLHPADAQPQSHTIRVWHRGQCVYETSLDAAHAHWQAMGYAIRSQRDNPHCVRQEQQRTCSEEQALWHRVPSTAWEARQHGGLVRAGVKLDKPRVAVLRTVGTNGHAEMAHAFYTAGFESVDVALADIQSGRIDLANYQVVALCGGFSYADVLGAGYAAAYSIRHMPVLRDAFQAFFARPDTLTLGVCNGCQILSHVADLIPGGTHFPALKANTSGRFEARLVTVAVPADTPASPWLSSMQGWVLPVVVAHGEGRMEWLGSAAESVSAQIALVYADAAGQSTTDYPCNPNGSAGGAAAFVDTQGGRVLAMMPHPERMAQPYAWGQCGMHRATRSPWIQLFENARAYYS